MWMWPHAMEAILLASMLDIEVRNREWVTRWQGGYLTASGVYSRHSLVGGDWYRLCWDWQSPCSEKVATLLYE